MASCFKSNVRQEAKSLGFYFTHVNSEKTLPYILVHYKQQKIRSPKYTSHIQSLLFETMAYYSIRKAFYY